MWQIPIDNYSGLIGVRIELTSSNHLALAEIPPFCKSHPALWFARAEALFALRGIESDDTKFHTIVWHLDNNNAALVQDIILYPPKENKYQALKTGLLSALSEQRLRKLVRKEGNTMPSVLLKQLMKLEGPDFSELYLRKFWSAQYPRELQIVIAAEEAAPWEVVGEKADKAWHFLLSERASTSKGLSLRKSNRQVAEPNASKKEPVCWYHKTHVYAFKCDRPCKYYEAFMKRFDPVPTTLEPGWGSKAPSSIPWA